MARQVFDRDARAPLSFPFHLRFRGLLERINAIQSHGRAQATTISTGWPAPLHQLACGVLHEWFAVDGESSPLLIFTHLARQTLHATLQGAGVGGSRTCVVWIGRRVWPYPCAIVPAPASSTAPRHSLLNHSLFVDAPDDAARLWAIDLAVRCPAVACVIADGSGLSLAHTRRLQLAASSSASESIGDHAIAGDNSGGTGASGGALVLLARPPADQRTLSCAATRWLVVPARSPETAVPAVTGGVGLTALGENHGWLTTEESAGPRWSVACVRCKGVQRVSGMEADSHLMLEWNRAQGCVRVPADLADRPHQAATPGAAIIRRTA